VARRLLAATCASSTAFIAVAVGRRLGVAEEQLPELLHGAQPHDVGKIALPETILHKPGPLDDEQWAFMRRHTVIGERFLLAVPALRRSPRSCGRATSAGTATATPTGWPVRRSRSAPGSSPSATPSTRW
jgi:hypothetical protein